MRECGHREHERYAYYRDLSVTYEGSTVRVPVKPPDISTHGMFINTPRQFPVGAVLKVRFWLVRNNWEVRARGEVRYCLPGVGVGMEFVELSEEARQAIQQEIAEIAEEAETEPAAAR